VRAFPALFGAAGPWEHPFLGYFAGLASAKWVLKAQGPRRRAASSEVAAVPMSPQFLCHRPTISAAQPPHSNGFNSGAYKDKQTPGEHHESAKPAREPRRRKPGPQQPGRCEPTCKARRRGRGRAGFARSGNACPSFSNEPAGRGVGCADVEHRRVGRAVVGHSRMGNQQYSRAENRRRQPLGNQAHADGRRDRGGGCSRNGRWLLCHGQRELCQCGEHSTGPRRCRWVRCPAGPKPSWGRSRTRRNRPDGAGPDGRHGP